MDLRVALNGDCIDLAICPLDVLEDGSGVQFQELMPGRNVVAGRSTHPLQLLLRRAGAPRSPAIEAFVAHLRRRFDALNQLTKRHEHAVV